MGEVRDRLCAESARLTDRADGVVPEEFLNAASESARRLTACGASPNNRAVLRRIAAACLVFVLPLGAAAAPLLHVHLDDDHGGDHHEGRALHGHLSEHQHAAPRSDATRHLEEPGDDRTLTPNLFVAMAVHGFELPAIPVERMRLAPTPERAARQVLQVTHGHDPPPLTSLAPRAPPSPLS